mmetsp:Transcript_29865/g.75165  ORF Transcript_29865/g.75165 Transcript_29865/m.75165 type:complete len:200 (+) Transcript_29865:1476-2075(+)
MPGRSSFGCNSAYFAWIASTPPTSVRKPSTATPSRPARCLENRSRWAVSKWSTPSGTAFCFFAGDAESEAPRSDMLSLLWAVTTNLTPLSSLLVTATDRVEPVWQKPVTRQPRPTSICSTTSCCEPFQSAGSRLPVHGSPCAAARPSQELRPAATSAPPSSPRPGAAAEPPRCAAASSEKAFNLFSNFLYSSSSFSASA